MRLIAGDQRVALCGQLSEVGWHCHAAPAVVIGIDGPLRFVGPRSNVREHESRVALIAPGFAHAVDVRDGRMAVFLLPPHALSRDGERPVRDLPVPGAWVELGRAVLRGELTAFEPVDHALARARVPGRPIDDRLRVAIELFAESLDENLPIASIASRAALSPSRLMALCREQLGTSLRSYRRWLRTFRVARAYAGGASLTQAALEAGFASSAHLSAAARAHFGIRPSDILAPSNRPLIRTV